MEEFTEETDPEYEQALKKYAVQCLLMEGSKMIIFFLVFGYLGFIKEYIVALLIMMTLRCNGGGLHCRHYISCLIVSFLVLAGGILAGIYCPLQNPYSSMILLACAYAGYRLVPVVSESRPEPDEELIHRSRFNTLRFILAYFFVICICPYSPYLNICTWTVMIHITQLSLARFLRRRRKHVSIS